MSQPTGKVRRVLAGWRVIQIFDDVKPKDLSGTFTIKSAAEEFAEMARKMGKNVSLREVDGYETFS